MKVEIVESTNKSNIKLKGTIVNETRCILTIKTTKGLKRTAKANSTFLFMFNGKKVKVNGKRIEKTPENRIKMKVKKW